MTLDNNLIDPLEEEVVDYNNNNNDNNNTNNNSNNNINNNNYNNDMYINFNSTSLPSPTVEFDNLFNFPSSHIDDSPFPQPPPPPSLCYLKSLSVLTWNINGVLDFNSRFQKLSHLRKFANFIKADVILLQETHVEENFVDFFSRSLNNYNWISSPLTSSYRGFSIGIRKSYKTFFKGSPLMSPSGTFFSTEASIRNVTIRISNVYIPPHQSSFNHSIESLSLIPSLHFSVVGGDFNAPSDVNIDKIDDLLAKYGVARIQLNGATHGRGNQLDHIYLPSSFLPFTSSSILPGVSNDHFLVHSLSQKPSRVAHKKIPDHIACSSIFIEKVFEIVGSFHGDAAVYAEKLIEAVKTCFEQWSNPPSNDVRELSLTSSLRFRLVHGLISLDSDDPLLKEYISRFNEISENKKINAVIKELNSRIEELCSNLAIPSSLYKNPILKGKIRSPPKPFSIRNPNGRDFATTPSTQSKLLFDHWSKLFATPRSFSQNCLDSLLSQYLKRVNKEFDRKDIDWSILDQIILHPSSSSPGPDGIPFSFFSATYTKLRPFWISLLNQIMDDHRPFCKEFFTGSNLFLIPKKEGIVDPGDFRPISVTPSIYRIVMKFFSKLLCGFLNDVISPHQRAILPGRKIDDCIFGIMDEFFSHDESVLLQTDFAKAFDFVNRSAIEQMIKHIGLPNELINVILVALSPGLVFFNGKSFISIIGVRQGCPISPIIFNLISDLYVVHIGYINDVRVVFAYCDDLAAIIRSVDALAAIRAHIALYEKSVGASLNSSKCSLLFRKHHWGVDGVWDDIEIVSTTRYLGIKFNSDGICKSMWGIILQKVKSRVDILRKRIFHGAIRISAISVYLTSLFSYVGRFFVPPQNAVSKFFILIQPMLKSWNGVPLATLYTRSSPFSFSKSLIHPVLYSVALICSRQPNDNCSHPHSPSGQRRLALNLLFNVSPSFRKWKIFNDQIAFNSWANKTKKKGCSILYQSMLEFVKGSPPVKLLKDLGCEEALPNIFFNRSLKAPSIFKDTHLLFLCKRANFNHQKSFFIQNFDSRCNLCHSSVQSHSHFLNCEVVWYLVNWIKVDFGWKDSLSWPLNAIDLIGGSIQLSVDNWLLRVFLLSSLRSISFLYNGTISLYDIGMDVVKRSLIYLGKKSRLLLRINGPNRFFSLPIGKSVNIPQFVRPISCGFFDGSSRSNNLVSGCGYVVYQDNVVVDVGGANLPFLSINDAEAFGLLLLLRKLKSIGLRGIKVFGDSKLVINCMDEHRWCIVPSLCNIFAEIVFILEELDITLCYISRELNKEADSVAYNYCLNEEVGRNMSVAPFLFHRSNFVFHPISAVATSYYKMWLASSSSLPSFPISSFGIESHFCQLLGLAGFSLSSRRKCRSSIVAIMEPLSKDDSYNLHEE